jgi:hypothetical protein
VFFWSQVGYLICGNQICAVAHRDYFSVSYKNTCHEQGYMTLVLIGLARWPDIIRFLSTVDEWLTTNYTHSFSLLVPAYAMYSIVFQVFNICLKIPGAKALTPVGGNCILKHSSGIRRQSSIF